MSGGPTSPTGVIPNAPESGRPRPAVQMRRRPRRSAWDEEAKNVPRIRAPAWPYEFPQRARKNVRIVRLALRWLRETWGPADGRRRRRGRTKLIAYAGPVRKARTGSDTRTAPPTPVIAGIPAVPGRRATMAKASRLRPTAPQPWRDSFSPPAPV